MTLSARQFAAAEMIANSFGALKEHQAALEAAPAGFAIYTGSADCPVWVNVEAAKAGKFSLSLKNATVYESREEAAKVARNVKNGHGERASVASLVEAHGFEVANHERLLTQVLK